MSENEFVGGPLPPLSAEEPDAPADAVAGPPEVAADTGPEGPPAGVPHFVGGAPVGNAVTEVPADVPAPAADPPSSPAPATAAAASYVAPVVLASSAVTNPFTPAEESPKAAPEVPWPVVKGDVVPVAGRLFVVTFVGDEESHGLPGTLWLFGPLPVNVT